MLPNYLDSGREIQKIINENVCCMIEGLVDFNEPELCEEMMDCFFPEYMVDDDVEKCVKIIKNLYNMTKDSYEREYLPPLYEWVLFYVISNWIDLAKDLDLTLNELPRGIYVDEDGFDLCDSVNDPQEYLTFMFMDWDFLQVDTLYSLYKRNPDIVDKILGTDISQYVELMPKDIQIEYKRLEKERLEEVEEHVQQEEYIINALHSYLQLESSRSMKYEGCSEVDLSDNIRNGLFQLFKEHGIDIEREVRGGYAVKDLGEMDFYISSCENGRYKKIAVGENKKWGNYEEAIGQLLGYMDSDVEFGFIIIYNDWTCLQTVLDGRIDILKKYNSQSDFKMVGEIEEAFNLENVLRTCHQNPEKAGSLFHLYHFVFNTYKPERKKAARASRKVHI